MANSKTEYIGDSVYVRFENGCLCLLTEDPLEPADKIYLEANVLIELIRFAVRVGLIAEPQKE